MTIMPFIRSISEQTLTGMMFDRLQSENNECHPNVWVLMLFFVAYMLAKRATPKPLVSDNR